MSSGIRLYHPKARSGSFTFEHNKRPYRKFNDVLKRHEATPHFCPACQKFHTVKTYHINVDAGGFAIVSTEVWEMMKRYGMAGFTVANEVVAPPAQTLSVGGNGAIMHLAPKEITSG